MKKVSSFFTILLLYIATVPTNVISLGAFTEVWIKDFQISRSSLTLLYLLSTGCVFFLLTAIKIRYSLKTTLFILGFCYLLTAFFISNITLFIAFIVLQWLGQGWMVEACRTLLLQSFRKTSYGLVVGCMEAIGTIAVFLCPFFFLWLMQNFNWNTIFIGLGVFYMIVGIRIGSHFHTNQPVPFLDICDKKFLLANIIIYLPVILASGFFFHLEACCKIFNLPLNLLESCALKQGVGIVILQIILGFFWKSIPRIAYAFLTLLLLSQIIWVLNLFAFNETLYLGTMILGWSLFGILINTFWQFLYRNNPALNEQKLKASVVLGFLANAVGPILFYALIKSILYID